MARNVIPLVPTADAYAKTETERRQQLFVWADRVLAELGLIDRIVRAKDLNDLRKIMFDPNAAMLAIREALHPASGKKLDLFHGLTQVDLKLILKNRFAEKKKERERQLRHSSGGQSSDWTDELILDKDGGVRPLLANLIPFLRHHRDWEGVLGFDEFGARVVIRKRPYWGEEWPDAPWSDHHEAETRCWFQHEGITAGLGDVGRAVQAAARYKSFHPVRDDYLDPLVWDGKRRDWLIDYFHCPDTPYVRAIGPRFLISAVARIYEPGCQADHMLVLEGPQGKQKSKTLRALAVRKDWFTDRLSPLASKDALIETAGIWIFEINEMTAVLNASAGTKKSYLTMREDRYRPPHGKHPISRPRQCIFAGSFNPPADGRYLTDGTGARRLWPVICHGMIDHAGVERDRDQIWAEAVARYKAGEPWWLETPELEELATAEQLKRLKAVVWDEPIKRWVGPPREGGRSDVSIREVAQGALGIEPEDLTHSNEIRIAKILVNQLDFVQCRPRRGNKRPVRYQRTPRK
jgi:predicted P-loop ATPase